MVTAAVLLTGPVVGLASARDLPAVTITIRHSHFTPTTVALPHGERVRIVVRNTDPIDHELIVGDAAVQAAHEHGTDTEHHAPGAVSVPALTTARTTVVIARAGMSLFGCHLPGHWAYGMHGVIVVT